MSLEEDIAEVKRIAINVTKTQPMWSGMLLRVVEALEKKREGEEKGVAAIAADPQRALEEMRHLVNCVWFLLETHHLLGEEGYTFPDGDHWTKEDLALWNCRST